MFGLLFASLPISQLWYAVPLVVAVSLVYAATRHELMEPILRHTVHTVIWITGFMLAVFAVLFVVTIIL
jgi:hypothetical protein